jgi:hypothetical protein
VNGKIPINFPASKLGGNKMDKDRKKELKELYAQSKPQMGILYFRCIPTDHIYLMAVTDTKGRLNGLKMRFAGNMYNGSRNKNIQSEWNQYGESQFDIKVLDILDYDKDETKTDYSEELAMLLEDWMKEYQGAEVIL